MHPPMLRPASGALLVALLLVTAGCTGASLGDGSTNTPTPTATPTTAEQTVVPEASYPEPPDTLTNESVEGVTVAYEEARLQNQLRETHDVTYFEMGYFNGSHTTVRNRTDDGVYVRIDTTYSYAYDNVVADFVPVCSLYHVNETAIRHVSETECKS